ncbi:phage tail tape measure protein [Rhodococcus sp. 1168]|uniref:phage tail tape measure protein n=1 Tax=Rhodococcus sp. 1168 TaxID=2018041 RepID=UPI000A0D515A|nr:phage tail tape measure protein [Rhodococcus sp. 1168]ORI15784.1 hypothetical protein BJI47_01435 [Rhodococcus sp. 1168]
MAGQSGDSGGGSFLSAFSSKVASLGGKGGPIAASLLGVAAIGLAAGAVLANAIADGMEQERQEDLLQAKLGVNPETARRIGEAAGLAYSNAWGESVTENMDAARAAIQSGLLTGEEDTKTFQATIEQLNIVKDIMGEDIPNLTRSASQAVKTGFATDAPAALDMFVKAQQAGLNTSEDFLDTIDEYGIQFKKLGLDGPEAMGLLSQAVQGGARDTDTAADALKEFSIRATDGSKASAEAFETMGMNAEEMTAKISLGGQDAQDGLEQVLTKLREMPPGLERTTTAVGLFGTKAEDMGDALYTMDLSTAVQQLGDVEGAAKKAGDTMSGNTAGSFESAKRSIETSSADIKLALAEAFGPALQDVANWVTENKPEIIGFFTGLADAGFATLDATLAFSSGALRAWAGFADGMGGTIAKATQFIAGMIEMSAKALDIIPGMGDQADEMHAVADGMNDFANSVGTAGDKARGMADMIDGARPGIQGMREDVKAAGERAETSARLMQALGTAVVNDIPDEKSIIIDSNTPEQQTALEALGLKVETLPDGTFKVTANTGEGQQAIDAFIGNNNGKNIGMFVDLRQRQIGYWRDQGVSEADAPSMQGPVPVVSPNSGNFGGGGGTFANGGIREAHDPQIGDGRTTRIWNEPETGGESYIPHAPSKRGRAEDILAITAKKFGFGLVKSFADGGVIGKDGIDASMQWAQSMDPVGYEMGGFSTASIDCSGAVSGAINRALGLDAYDSRMSTVSEGAWLQHKGAILGRGPEGSLRVGWWDQGGGANGHTAMTYPDGTNFESNGSEGVVVGGPTGADDPSFDQQAWFPMSGDLGMESDTGTGSNPDTSTSGGTDSAYAITDSGVDLSTDGDRVFVTNWPSTLGGTDKPAEERTPILTAGLKVFANGGEDHSAQIGNGTTRMWNEPETGGEGYIPLAPSKRGRSVAITKQIAKRFGYDLIPMADGGLTGFGGYQNSDRPTLDIPLNGKGQSANKQRANFNNLLALAVGGANTIASGFDANGNFTGKFDSGSNSPAILEAGLSQVLEVLDQIKEAAQAKTPVDVQVDIDQGNRSANIAIMKAGL